MTKAAGVRLESLFIEGPAGRLEALLRLPAFPRGAAVMAHPHPLHGGTMRTKVLQRAARLLSDRLGLAVLRFNLRGVGSSSGAYSGGPGETRDLVAASRWLRESRPDGPFVLGGFSFGAVCALHAASVLEPDVIFLIGLPTRRYRSVPTAPAGAKVFWIQGELDEYSRPERAREVAKARSWEFALVRGADHLFEGRLDELEAAAAEGLRRALGERSP